MKFGQAIGICFSKYVDFSGRAQRSEFWWWILFTWLASLILGTLENGIVGATGGVPIMNTLFSLATFLPSLAVGIRRLHDINRSGWWWLIFLVPLVGWIILIVWFAQRGDAGSNDYGDDPLSQDSSFDDGDDDSRSSGVPTVKR